MQTQNPRPPRGARTLCVPQLELDDFDLGWLTPADFAFAVVTDTHARGKGGYFIDRKCFEPGMIRQSWRERPEINHCRARKAYDQVNRSGADFLLHLGDMTSGHPPGRGWLKEARHALRLLGRLKIPYRLVAGNHDIGNKYTFDRGGVNLHGIMANPVNVAAYRKTFGEPYFAFRHKGSLFVVLCDGLLNSGEPLELKQWAWLETLLAREARRVKNVVCAWHALPYWNTPADLQRVNYEVVDQPARARILDLCARHGVRAILTGHTHWEILNRHAGTWLFTAHSTAFTRNGSFFFYPELPSAVDPAKAGWYLMRVRGRRIARHFTRMVDLLPDAEARQRGRAPAPRRLMTLQAAEGRPANLALTVPPIWERLSDGHPEWPIAGLREPPAAWPDSMRAQMAWRSKRLFQRSKQCLLVEFPRVERLDQLVLTPDDGGFPGRYEILTSLDGARWQCALRAEPRPGPEPAAHALGGVKARFIQYHVYELSSGQVGLRGFECFNADGVNVALKRLGARATASTRDGIRESAKNTLPLSHAFDLNPAVLRVAEEATAWEAVEPLPGALALDRLVEETVAHAAQEGLRVCVVVSGRHAGLPARSSERSFRTYVRLLAEKLSAAKLWELDGAPAQVKTAQAEIRRLVPGARFVPRSGAGSFVQRPPFASARDPVPAKALLREAARLITRPGGMPCYSLRPGMGSSTNSRTPCTPSTPCVRWPPSWPAHGPRRRSARFRRASKSRGCEDRTAACSCCTRSARARWS
ncbi:MAG: metallophosphoesterase [Planctomycetota bacterium]|nr:metallophosphoesterase [Planctomycetota bacterium]